MGGMKRSMKTSLIIIALALLACFVVLRSRRNEPDTQVGPVEANGSETSRGPSFEVHVVKPLSARPLFGLLGLLGINDDSELRFDHTSSGAAIDSVGHDRLELSAESWDLFIEINGEGRIAPGTHLVFPLELGGRQVKLRCRPANPGIGHLQITTRTGSDDFSGSFVVELATCENAESGKPIEWPPAPLTVRGRFAGLPPARR
jgi:hypothetical protein